MSFVIVLAALLFLMYVAYRGHSVILFAPVAALGAVLLTDPSLVAPMFTGLFMDKMVGFLKLYFPVFLLGAVFGKVIELSGFSKSIVAATIKVVGAQRAILSIVLVCALLTYGGVSLFVVVFAVYPFAAELFRQASVPKNEDGMMFWICGVPGSASMVKVNAPSAIVPGIRRLGMPAWRNSSAANG